MSEILEKYKGKKIIVALPGDSFSGDFLINLILLKESHINQLSHQT